MPLPALIPAALWIASLAGAGYGAGAAIDGHLTKKEAREILDRVQRERSAIHGRAEQAQIWQAALQTRFVALGESSDEILPRLIALVEALGDEFGPCERAGRFRREKMTLSDVEGTPRTRGQKAFRTSLDTLKGAAVGAAARQGAIAAIQLGAKASTGTAIRSLTGVAAQRATLSAAGGGAIAAGGGGIAAGLAALNLLTVGATAAIWGQRYSTGAHEKLEDALKVQGKHEAEMQKEETRLCADELVLETFGAGVGEAEEFAGNLVGQVEKCETAQAEGQLQEVASDIQFAVEDFNTLQSMIRELA